MGKVRFREAVGVLCLKVVVDPLVSIQRHLAEDEHTEDQKSWSVLKATAMAAAELCLELGPIPEEVVAVVEEAVGEAHSHVFQLAMAFH